MNNIVLKTNNQNITLSQKTQNVSLTQKTNTIDLTQPEHKILLTQKTGNEIEMIQKVHDITFSQSNLRGLPGEGSDKNYTTTFAPTDTLVVTHNLNKYPAVSIITSAGDEVVGSVEYLTLNSLMLVFSSSFGGRVTCN